MLDEAELLQTLRRRWEYPAEDEDLVHRIYHDDAVLEFPQSGEQFEGVQNFREWRRQFPAKLEFHLRSSSHLGDRVVTEYTISYKGAPWLFTVSIMELEDDRVAHERTYVTEGWEPAEWRAPWRAEQPEDPAPPWMSEPPQTQKPWYKRSPQHRRHHPCDPRHPESRRLSFGTRADLIGYRAATRCLCRADWRHWGVGDVRSPSGEEGRSQLRRRQNPKSLRNDRPDMALLLRQIRIPGGRPD